MNLAAGKSTETMTLSLFLASVLSIGYVQIHPTDWATALEKCIPKLTVFALVRLSQYLSAGFVLLVVDAGATSPSIPTFVDVHMTSNDADQYVSYVLLPGNKLL